MWSSSHCRLTAECLTDPQGGQAFNVEFVAALSPRWVRLWRTEEPNVVYVRLGLPVALSIYLVWRRKGARFPAPGGGRDGVPACERPTGIDEGSAAFPGPAPGPWKRAGNEDAADRALEALLAAAAEPVEPRPPPTRRRRTSGGAAAAAPAADEPEVDYPTLGVQVRASFERFHDVAQAVPMVRTRKRARPGNFSSPRLGMIQDVVLSIVSGGLSAEDQNRIYALLGFCEATMPGAAEDDGESVPIRTSFKTPHAFRQALSDDI